MFKDRVFQNVDTRDNKNLPTGSGVSYLHRFQRHMLRYTNSKSVQEVHAFSRPGSVLQVQISDLKSHNSKDSSITGQSGLATHIPHRVTDSNRKAGPPRLTPYEANTMAPEKQLEGSRITRKGYLHPKIFASSSKMVAGGKQCTSRSTITPTKHALRIITDA